MLFAIVSETRIHMQTRNRHRPFGIAESLDLCRELSRPYIKSQLKMARNNGPARGAKVVSENGVIWTVQSLTAVK